MAKRSIPNSSERRRSIDRRRFLTSAALAMTASITAAMNPADATLPETLHPLPPPSEIPVLKVSAVTASRIAEITARNNLRKESGLPLLSIPKELRRIKNAEASATFAEFCDAFREPVEGKVLARFRRRCGDPNWVPNGMLSGMAFEYEVSRELRKVYERIG